MPKRTTLTSQDYLVSAALPEQTETYTVISHGAVINHTKQMLDKKGFTILREFYRCNDNARVAQGIYHLKYGTDPDMGMMFAWSNSYDKSMKFKCSIGGFVHASLAGMLGANMGTFIRKHTGTADNEAFDSITNQIENAEEYFKALVNDKEVMKNISVTEEHRASLMGQIYFIYELLTGEQMNIARNEFNKPSFKYTGIENSLWSMYNGIIYSLQKAHPKTWMDQQSMVHWFICNHFKIIPGMPIVIGQNGVNGLDTLSVIKTDPNQLDLMDLIADIEKEVVDDLNEEPLEVILEVKNEESIIEESTISPEIKQVEEQSVEFLMQEPEIETLIIAEDEGWHCVSCGKLQGFASIFHDGQICTECNDFKL